MIFVVLCYLIGLLCVLCSAYNADHGHADAAVAWIASFFVWIFEANACAERIHRESHENDKRRNG